MNKFHLPRNIGIVLINGFSAAFNDYEPLMPYLGKSKNVMIISLPGDPSEIDAKDFIPYQEWLAVHEAAIDNLKKRVKELYIVGFSVGAVPACYFAQRFSCQRLILISPVFNYDTFDDSATSVVRIVRSMALVGPGKADPINSVKSIWNLRKFFEEPKKNFGELFKVRVGPLMNPSNILLFPIITLFDDELAAIDKAGGKIVKKIAQRNYADFDYNDSDLEFGRYETPRVEKVKNKFAKKFDDFFTNLKKVIPADFVNLTSEGVYNMLKLLAYCDHYTDSIGADTKILIGFQDATMVNSDLKKVMDKITSTYKKVVGFPTDEHSLFASPYFHEVAEDVIDFISKKKI